MMRWGFPGNLGYGGHSGIGGYSAYGGNYGWMGLVGMGIHLLFWIGIILLALYLIRRHKKNPHHSLMGMYPNDALDILRERYARGEIDTEEFESRRVMLQKP